MEKHADLSDGRHQQIRGTWTVLQKHTLRGEKNTKGTGNDFHGSFQKCHGRKRRETTHLIVGTHDLLPIADSNLAVETRNLVSEREDGIAISCALA